MGTSESDLRRRGTRRATAVAAAAAAATAAAAAASAADNVKGRSQREEDKDIHVERIVWCIIPRVYEILRQTQWGSKFDIFFRF